MINPNGLQLLLYPFKYVSEGVYGRYVLEWQAPRFDNLAHILFGVVLVLAVAVATMRRRELGGARVLWVLVFGAMALVSMRHIPVFLVVATPVAAGGIALLSLKGKRTAEALSTHLGWTQSWADWRVLAVTGLSLLTIAASFPYHGQEADLTKEGAFPKGCADYLASTGQRGNILNPFNWGGYLIFRLYPDCRVAIDPRPDVYGERLVGLSVRLDDGPPDWRRLVESQKPDCIVWFSNSPLPRLIGESGEWRLSYADPVGVVFRRVVR